MWQSVSWRRNHISKQRKQWRTYSISSCFLFAYGCLSHKVDSLFEKRLHTIMRRWWMAQLLQRSEDSFDQSVDSVKWSVTKLALYGSVFKGIIHSFWQGKCQKVCTEPKLNELNHSTLRKWSWNYNHFKLKYFPRNWGKNRLCAVSVGPQMLTKLFASLYY